MVRKSNRWRTVIEIILNIRELRIAMWPFRNETGIELSLGDANALIQSFACVLSEADQAVLDSRRLPASRLTLAVAFEVEIARLEAASTAVREANKNRLEQLRALEIRIWDFVTVDSEDQNAVNELNAKWATVSEIMNTGKEIPQNQAWLRNAVALLLKYNRRGMEDHQSYLREAGPGSASAKNS